MCELEWTVELSEDRSPLFTKDPAENAQYYHMGPGRIIDGGLWPIPDVQLDERQYSGAPINCIQSAKSVQSCSHASR